MIDITPEIVKNLKSTFPNVRNAFDKTKIKSFPTIVVQQIDNYEILRYTTIDDSQYHGMAFQIEIYCKDTAMCTAEENASLEKIKVNEMLNKMGLRLQSSPAIIPSSTDRTISRAILRYLCKVDLNNNKIYKN
jgi:hypothetical protein